MSLVNPEDILRVQKTSSYWYLAVLVPILVVQGISCGPGYSYAGLSLPYHRSNSSGMLYLTDSEGSWYLSVTPISMSVGALMSAPASEVFGRKKILLASNVVSLIGVLIMYFATSFPLLLVGRIIQPIGNALGIISNFVYMSEISTVKLRGVLQSTVSFSQPVGSFIMAVIATLVDFRYVMIYMMCIHGFLFLTLQLLPETPHWLVRKQRSVEAKSTIQLLRGKKYEGSDLEVMEIENVVQDSIENSSKRNVFTLLLQKNFYRPFIRQAILFLLLGTCGVDSIYYYGPLIYSKFKFFLPYKVLVIFLSLGQCLGLAVSVPTSAKLGRRPQLCLSAGIQGLALVGFGCILYDLNRTDSASTESTIGLMITTLIITFSFGFGFNGIPYILCGEFFTPESKVLASNICQFLRTASTFCILKIYPLAIEALGESVVYWIHAGISIFAAIYVFTFIPETKGKTLTQLSNLFIKSNDGGSKTTVTSL